MEKWSRYFLSLFFLFHSCQEEESSVSLNHTKVADSIFNLNKNLFQGSKESQLVLNKVIEVDSTHDDALREISVPYLKRGMLHEWKPRYQKAVDADPQTWVPMRGYLYLLFYRDYKKAIADFNASDSITPYLDYPQGHSVDYWRGIAYLGLKDYQNSVSYWDRHIAKETTDSGEDWVELEAFLYRGIAHYESGNSEKALENFDKILTYFKTSVEAKYYYAKILLEKGDKTHALKFCEGAKVDLKNKLGLHHNYVEMLRQVYLSDIEELKSEIMR